MSQTYVDPVSGHHIVSMGNQQMAYDHVTGKIWNRFKVGNDWLSWTEVIQESKIQGKQIDFVVFDESEDTMKNEPNRKQYLTEAEQRRNYFLKERELRGQTIEQQARQEKRQQAYKDKNWGEFA